MLVAAVGEGHPAHVLALPWFQRVKDKADTGVVTAHSLAEMYAMLTRLPVRPSISPEMAREVITANVLDTCEVVALSAADYVTPLKHWPV